MRKDSTSLPRANSTETFTLPNWSYFLYPSNFSLRKLLCPIWGKWAVNSSTFANRQSDREPSASLLLCGVGGWRQQADMVRKGKWWEGNARQVYHSTLYLEAPHLPFRPPPNKAPLPFMVRTETRLCRSARRCRPKRRTLGSLQAQMVTRQSPGWHCLGMTSKIIIIFTVLCDSWQKSQSKEQTFSN